MVNLKRPSSIKQYRDALGSCFSFDAFFFFFFFFVQDHVFQSVVTFCQPMESAARPMNSQIRLAGGRM